MSDTIRAFVAVEIPEDIRRAVGRLAVELQKTGTKATWTREENLHLTLKFLGETTVAQLDLLKETLNAAALRHAAFKANLMGLGGFPNEKRPRILWVGMEAGTKELVALARDVEGALEPLGFPPEEREFAPHLTLGRIKFPKPNAELEKKFLEEKSRSYGGWKVAEVKLIQSTLHPEGPKYEVIHSSKLKS